MNAWADLQSCMPSSSFPFRQADVGKASELPGLFRRRRWRWCGNLSQIELKAIAYGIEGISAAKEVRNKKV